MKNIRNILTIGLVILFIAGCTPPVGSEAWCKHMKNKDAGDWSANEAADYAKHCMFKAN